MRYGVIATAFGHVGLAWRGAAVTGLTLPAAQAGDAARGVLRKHPDALPGEPPRPVADAIVRYFAGEPVDFADVALDLGEQSDFAARVYAHIRQICRGETTTYGAIARALGAEPVAAQSVGRAMATNPVPLIVPCHRVLAANALGGFSAPGGGGTKARMLALEGATIAGQRAFAF